MVLVLTKLDLFLHTVCHAEMNAVMNKNCGSVKGCTIYVALFPCNECTKVIVQSGIKEVVYMSDTKHDKPSMVASRRLLDVVGIPYRYVGRMYSSIQPCYHIFYNTTVYWGKWICWKRSLKDFYFLRHFIIIFRASILQHISQMLITHRAMHLRLGIVKQCLWDGFKL